MICVIIAGGSGTRLWPLSKPDYPKHLLTIASDKSLLRNTYERAKKLTDKIYVVSDISHAHHISDHIPELDAEYLIVEPGRRGTANCIIAALVKLRKENNPNEIIAFLHADHYIRDTRGFIHSFEVAADVSKENNRLVLVGVEPDYPATGFGYIQKDGMFDDKQFVYEVDSFKEKPDYVTAQKYVQSGDYLWNCGYFVGSINTFENTVKKFSPRLFESMEKLKLEKTAAGFNRTYLKLESDSIDYALIERVDNLLVVPATFDWMDLGSYNDIHKAVETDKNDIHVHGNNIGLEGVTNAYIHNEEDKPVAVIGLDNVVVVNTPNGLLVARKDQSQKVKDVLAELNQREK